MTKRKGTSDLLADICEHEASMPDPLSPTYGEPAGQQYASPALVSQGETFDQFRSALRAGDIDKATKAGRTLNYPDKLTSFLADVVRTEREMVAAIPDLDGMAAKIATLDHEIAWLRRSRPGSAEEAAKISKRLEEIEPQVAKLRGQRSDGVVLSNRINWLRAWGGCLFDVTARTGQLPDDLAARAKEIGLDPCKSEDWRVFGCPPQAPRRRRARLRTGFGQS